MLDSNPEIPELYPNMCNSNDGNWNSVKNKLSEKYGELTSVWYIGIPNRKIAHKKNILSIKDKKCTCDNLGIKKGNRYEIINQILNTNRGKKLIVPDKLNKDQHKIIAKSNNDYYIDFETINGLLYINPEEIDIQNSKSDNDILFIIGIGFEKNENICTKHIISKLNLNKNFKDDCGVTFNESDNWEYICFYMKSYCIEQEYSVIKSFMNFINLRQENFNNKSRLFHWSPAEPKFMENSRKRHYDIISTNKKDIKMVNYFDTFDKTTEWVDLYNLFITCPITIKGCTNFKLKSIAKVLHKNNMINTVWEDNSISNGLTAMTSAIKIYQNIDKYPKTRSNLCNNKIFNSIIKYNEIDCKTVWEINELLRKKYL